MSTAETIPENLAPESSGNPLLEQEGLTELQTEEAQVLRQDLEQAAIKKHQTLNYHQQEHRDYGQEGYKPGYAREISDMFEEAGDAIRLSKAMKASKKHYKKNEGAYQTQAVKDAASENVHTNFGT